MNHSSLFARRIGRTRYRYSGTKYWVQHAIRWYLRSDLARNASGLGIQPTNDPTHQLTAVLAHTLQHTAARFLSSGVADAESEHREEA